MSARPAPTCDKLLQGHEYLLRVYILSKCTQFSKYFQHLLLYCQDTAQPSLVLHKQRLQGKVVNTRLEIHKGVISYQMEGTLHGQGFSLKKK